MRAALALCVVAACGTPDHAPRWRPAGRATPRDGGVLRVAFNNTIGSLDPTLTNDDTTSLATHAMFDTLIAYEPVAPGSAATGRRFVPALAERWTITPDGLTYTFTLRAGVTYHDGTPIVAADARGAIEHTLRTPGAPGVTLLGDIVGADAVIAGAAGHARGLEVPDPRTFIIHLARPNGTLLGVLTMVLAAPQPEGRDPDQRPPMASGPFELVSWDRGARLVLRKNPRYWDAAAIHLGGLEVRENVPNDVQFLMFERGELDAAAFLEAPDALWLAEQPAWAPYLRHASQLAVFGARLNVRVKPFDDRRVRVALNLAFDKDHVIKLLQGAATIAHGPLPPGLAGRDDTIAPYPHDPVRARALLAEAGYGSGFDVDYAISDTDSAARIAASLQADLAEVGVRLHVRSEPNPTWIGELASSHGPPMMMVSWLYDYPDPANVFDLCFAGRAIAEEGSLNFSSYATPELDALLDAARAEPDPEARAALYRRADRIVHDDAPWIWAYHPELVEVVQPYVAGYAPHPVWPRDFTRAWLDVGDDGEPVPR